MDVPSKLALHDLGTLGDEKLVDPILICIESPKVVKAGTICSAREPLLKGRLSTIDLLALTR
jgi:hypothetical protein